MAGGLGVRRSAATAELALGVPLLLALTVGLVWMLAWAPPRCASSTRPARPPGDRPRRRRRLGRAVALRIAPEGASVRVEVGEDRVVVVTSARVAAPGGLLASVPGVTVSDEAVALVEVSSP